jgi:hypothetical protein
MYHILDKSPRACRFEDIGTQRAWHDGCSTIDEPQSYLAPADTALRCHSPEGTRIIMFGLFKREPHPEARQRAERPRSSSAQDRSYEESTEPMPLPEVVEGNEPTDWDLWNDSVRVMDSRLQQLQKAAHHGPDPFANVGKNRDA